MIADDERHTGTIVLAKEEVPARDFSDWSMSFRDLNRSDVLETPGYSEFMNLPLTDISNPSRSMKLVRLFRAKM